MKTLGALMIFRVITDNFHLQGVSNCNVFSLSDEIDR